MALASAWLSTLVVTSLASRTTESSGFRAPRISVSPVICAYASRMLDHVGIGSSEATSRTPKSRAKPASAAAKPRLAPVPPMLMRAFSAPTPRTACAEPVSARTVSTSS